MYILYYYFVLFFVLCRHLPTNASFWQILTKIDKNWRYATFAVNPFVNFCQILSNLVNFCQGLTRFVKFCQDLSKKRHLPSIAGPVTVELEPLYIVIYSFISNSYHIFHLKSSISTILYNSSIKKKCGRLSLFLLWWAELERKTEN